MKAFNRGRRRQGLEEVDEAHCGWKRSTVQCVEVCGTLHCGNVGGSVEVCLLHTVAHFGWKCLTAAHWGPPAMLSARAKGKTVAKMQTDELLQKLANSIYAITNQPQYIHLSSVSITHLLLRQGNCLCVVSCGKSDFFVRVPTEFLFE